MQILRTVILQMVLGVRVSLFVSGCRHRAKGVLMQKHGILILATTLYRRNRRRVDSIDSTGFYSGIYITWRTTIEPENQVVLVHLLRKIRKMYPQKDIWCYTGYLYDVDLVEGGKVFTNVTKEMLSYVDVLVDGEFIEAEKDLSLEFRGSRNQRIVKREEFL